MRPIRDVYLSLHQDTDSAPTQLSASTRSANGILWYPSSYPLCRVSDHRSDLTPHTHVDGVSATPAGAIPHDDNDAAFVPSITGPDPPPSPTHRPLPVFAHVPPLDTRIPVRTSTQVIGRTITEGRRTPTISSSPVIEPSRTTQPSVSSPSLKSNASASPLDDIAVAHSTLSCAPLGNLDVRSSLSPTPVLDAILNAGSLSFQAATRSDLSFVYYSNGI